MRYAGDSKDSASKRAAGSAVLNALIAQLKSTYIGLNKLLKSSDGKVPAEQRAAFSLSLRLYFKSALILCDAVSETPQEAGDLALVMGQALELKKWVEGADAR